MRRYRVLPAGFDLVKDPIDVYATDRNYWHSLWWNPEPKEPELNTELRILHEEAEHAEN
jgi:hypothetical protein